MSSMEEAAWKVQHEGLRAYVLHLVAKVERETRPRPNLETLYIAAAVLDDRLPLYSNTCASLLPHYVGMRAHSMHAPLFRTAPH